MLSLDDTIAAIATPLGQGGIGIVRLSGPDAVAIAGRIFRPASRARVGLRAYGLVYGHVHDPQDDAPVDEVLVAYMPAPRSYTRQDVVEIQAHGGPLVLRRVLALCLQQGARHAERGEFTLRAYLNGRIDLAQAEAVRDVVTARTTGALQVAVAQLDGRLSRRVAEVRDALLRVLAYLEARIDFPEDDVPAEPYAHGLRRAAEALRSLEAEAERGALYREGARAAIVGRPNVGKSSLLNALLGRERALVTPYPGTTRDTVEEAIDLRGVPLVLVDTAGITSSEDPVEQLGIARSRQALEGADVALLVVDRSEPPTAEDAEIAALVAERCAVLVRNKADLPAAHGHGRLLPHAPRVDVSALTGHGLDGLCEALRELLLGVAADGAPPEVSNPRHRALLAEAEGHLRAALQAEAGGEPEDIVAIDVTAAVEALGQITGQTAGEDLLATIFGAFCLGK